MNTLWMGMLISVLTGVAVNEACDLSPWLARRVIRRASRLWALGDPDAVALVEEELAAILEDCPGKFTKLLFALRFLIGATTKTHRRTLRRFAQTRRRFSATRTMRRHVGIGWFAYAAAAIGSITIFAGILLHSLIVVTFGVSELLCGLILIRGETNRGIRRAEAAAAFADSVLATTSDEQSSS